MERRCVTALPGRQFLLLTASLIVWLALATAVSASTVDVDLLSDGRGALPLYRVGSTGNQNTYRVYVEALKGDNYGIRVRNNTGRRVGVVVAVDGRNIISGKRSNLRKNEQMYILGPHESATYDGWRTARNTVNRFYFTEPGDSYAGAFGDYSAMGVVAVAVYREREVPASNVYNRQKDGTGREERSENPAPGTMGAEEGAAGKPAEKRSGEAVGTGFGDGKHSPSYRVRFTPESRVAERHFLKYEWRSTLCRKGIVDCRWSRNRFWDDDDGYAPVPPGRQWGRNE